MIQYKISNVIKRPELSDVKLGGYVGTLADTFFEGRIFSDYARNTVYREAEDAFKNQVDDKTVVGYWQGEFWGKWIISAARVARYTCSKELCDFIHRGAHKLMEYQREDGYIGTYKNSANFFAPDPEVSRREVGVPLNWNWNIWCRKYTLWGLIEAYTLTEDEKILSSCIKMADQLIDEVEKSGAALAQTGTFNGLASCSIIKPLLILYRMSENKKYLDFCKKVADRWENAELIPALIANPLSGKRLREWYPDSNKWAKAYEMMSCYDGLLELYRITGNSLYFEATKAFYDIICEHEYNALYSVAFNDVFGDAAYDVNCITEPCDVIHFMRLSHELFLLTGEAKYMDKFELAAYNPFLVSAFKDGKWGARGARGASRHLVANIQAGFVHNHCCVNNMPRGFMNIADSTVTSSDDTLWVNLYTEFEGQIKVGNNNVSVKIEGDYLDTSCAKININADEPVKVKLRVPAWSESSLIIADGVRYTPENGTYFAVDVKSDLQIEVMFDNTPKVIERNSHPELGDLPWKEGKWLSLEPENTSAAQELFLRTSVSTIRKGAVLLCRTKLIGNSEEEIFSQHALTAEYKSVALKRLNTCQNVNLEYEIAFSNGEKELSYHVADYASGCNMILDDKKYFSIYF